MIVKKGRSYVVKSHDGAKELGTYSSEADASERLRQIEAAKAAKAEGPKNRYISESQLKK